MYPSYYANVYYNHVIFKKFLIIVDIFTSLTPPQQEAMLAQGEKPPAATANPFTGQQASNPFR